MAYFSLLLRLEIDGNRIDVGLKHKSFLKLLMPIK